MHRQAQAREAVLREAFAGHLGGRSPAEKFGLDAPEGAVADGVLQATVLFADIRNFTSLAEKLDSGEVAQLLTRYFECASAAVLAHGGRHLKFIGDGLVAAFVQAPQDGSPLPAARRAVSAALALTLASHEFRHWLEQRFAGRGLPPFAIGVGLQAGAVTIWRLGAGEQAQTAPVGDAVDTAARLESASKELGWTVVASAEVLRQAGAGVHTAGMTSLEVPGSDGYVDVAEITGLDASADDLRHGGIARLAERAHELRLAVKVNSELTARAVKGALAQQLSTIRGHDFAAGRQSLRLKGYRLTSRIASGGMTQVYLATRESDGLPVVLKVLAASGAADGTALARLVHEYTLLSRIEHPNVVRIYDQGHADGHAYLAMEYFRLGDLAGELRRGMARQRVLDVLAQMARALEAIHGRGIVHRDLKPENVMLRADGSVVLADFGVAKSIRPAQDVAGPATPHGDRIGTPYYLSPEQAAGREVTPASDLYSLGVVLYEMLTGERPYRADSLESLLACHQSAPTPKLPLQHARLQPVLDRLMAKQPQDRYPSAAALLHDLQARELLGQHPPAG